MRQMCCSPLDLRLAEFRAQERAVQRGGKTRTWMAEGAWGQTAARSTMSILDPILVAFIAGMAVRDLWPLWVRRAARSKRVGASTRVAGSGGRRPPMRRRASRVKIDDDPLLRCLRERNRALTLSARDDAGHDTPGRILLTDPVACIVSPRDIVPPPARFL